MFGPSERSKFTLADPLELLTFPLADPLELLTFPLADQWEHPSTDCKQAVVRLGDNLSTMVAARSHFEGSPLKLASYSGGSQAELADWIPYGHIHIR